MSSSSSPRKILSDPRVTLREVLFVAGLLLVPFLPYILTVARLSYISYNNASDSFLYVDIARNIASGRGFAISFNFYRYWTGIFYPAVAFVQVGLPLALSGVYALFRSVGPLFYFNLFLGFANCLLIYGLIRRLYRDKAGACWCACLIAATVSMEISVLRILTEQMSLFLTLCALGIFSDTKNASFRRVLCVGLLLGANVLVRSSSVFYPIAFSLAALLGRGPAKTRIAEALLLLAIPVVVLSCYEALVFFRYHAFFPEYPLAFKNYYLATYAHGGVFFPQAPVTRPLAESLGAWRYWGNNIGVLGKVLFCILRMLLVFAALRMVRAFGSRDRAELLLIGLSVLQILAPLFFYAYMPIEEFHWSRFLLLPVIFLVILAVRELRDLGRLYFKKTGPFLFHGLLAIVFVSNFYQTGRVLAVYWQESERTERVRELSALAGWVRQNTKDPELVAASEYVLGGVWLDRPIVNIPVDRLLSRENLKDFVTVFKPKAFVFEKTIPIQGFLRESGYREAPNRPAPGRFTVYELSLDKL